MQESWLWAIVAAIALTLGVVVGQVHQRAPEDTSALQKAVTELQSEVEGLKAEVSHLRRGLRIAYLDSGAITKSFNDEGTKTLDAQIKIVQGKLEALQESLRQGKIGQEQYDRESVPLQ